MGFPIKAILAGGQQVGSDTLEAMKTRYRIVRLLADGQFHSGEQLARSLNITRAAVWKHLSHIRSRLDVEVFAVSGKGYRLARPLELLEQHRILQEMGHSSRRLLSDMEILDQIESTNGYLMRRGSDSTESGHVCLTEQQTAGRGRRGRKWISPFGSNIYLSIHWKYALGPADLGGLSLAAGIAVAQSLEQQGIQGIGLKWPNDVLWNHRKLSGLLLEVRGEQGGPSQVVLGVGLNTRLTEHQAQEIEQPWVDLASVPGGAKVSRNRLVAVLLDNLLDTMNRFEREGLEPFIREWGKYDLYQGQAVTLQLGHRCIEGIHQGIDQKGALLLQHNGGVYSYHGGEVSLRSTVAREPDRL